MTQGGAKGVGVVAIALSETLDDQTRGRARAIVERLARGCVEEPVVWEDFNTALVIRGLSVGVADETWKLAGHARGELIALDAGVRIGLHAEVAGAVGAVKSFAEYMARHARPGGMALSWPLLRSLSSPEWRDLTIEPARDIVHYAAIGEGLVPAQAQEHRVQVERYVASGANAPTDDEGFLDLEHAADMRRVGALVREERALILGEPWIGKTWVAEQIVRQLRRQSRFVWFVSFEHEREGEIPEREWERWKASGEAAYLVVDALDEGIYRGSNIDARLHWLRESEADRRLHVLAFSRASHAERALEALGWPESAAEKLNWHLLPLDPEEAARALRRQDETLEKGRERVQRVREHVRQLEDPSLVGDFVVLSTLSELEQNVDAAQLELAVIDRLCTPRGTGPLASSASARRDAAARIAAVLQFSGLETFDLDESHAGPRGLDGAPVRLSEIFPDGDRALAAATRDLWKSRTPLFERTADGHRFRQHFAKQRLAAHALRVAPSSLVRVLVAGPRGGVVADHRAVVERLASTTARRELQHLLQEQARPLDEAKAVELWDHLLDLTAAGLRSWDLHRDGALKALAHPTIAGLAADTVRNGSQPSGTRVFALDVASANATAPGWEGLADAALQLALDRDEAGLLREQAVRFLCYRNAPATERLRPRLDVLLDEGFEKSALLRATILESWLERGESALQVARRAPAPEPHLFDARVMLVHEIAQKMTDDEVRAIVDQALGRRDAGLPLAVLHELHESAFERLALVQWDEEDTERVMLALDRGSFPTLSLHEAVQSKAEYDAGLRRKLYLMLANTTHEYLVKLNPKEDAAWLAAELAAGRATQRKHWFDAYWLAGDPATPVKHRARIERWLKAHHPDLVAELEARTSEDRRKQQQRTEVQKVQERQRRERKRFVGDVVDEILSDPDFPPASRIRSLGWVLFSSRYTRPTNVVGGMDALGPQRQTEVLQRLKADFEQAEPTSVPAGRRGAFSSFIAHEAAAFGEAVLLSEDDAWLDGPLVAKWLRSAVFVHDRRRPAVIAACYARAPHETKIALLERLALDAASEDKPGIYDVPVSVLEDGEFVSRVLEIAGRPDTKPQARRQILWSLAARIGDRRFADRLAMNAWPDAAKRVAAATRAYLRGGEGVADVLQDLEGDEIACLEPLLEYADSWRVDVRRWQSRPLAELSTWLLERFPLKQDPPDRLGFQPVTLEIKLRRLRDTVISELELRSADEPAAESAVKRLATIDSKIADLHACWQSTRLANEVFAAAQGRLERLAPRRVAERLEDGEVRRLRNVDDLYYVLLEQLGVIRESAPRHTAMVWVGPSKSDTKGAPKETSHDAEKHERRLHQYVQMRLSDLASARFRSSVSVVAEATEGYRDKPDLLATIGSDSVAIEIKWSHHKRCVPALEDQLVQRYLLDQGRSHGIYVVGYAGLPPSRTEDEMLEQLRARAEELQNKNPHIRVAVIVLPFERAAPTGKPRSR